MRIREDLDPLRTRVIYLFLFIFIALLALQFRLAHLQVINGTMWRSMAENNRLRRIPLPSPRGRIYDRRGRVLAHNIPTWELLVFPGEARSLSETALFLARSGIADFRTTLERMGGRESREMAPTVVGENLSWNEVARIRAHQSEFPELAVVAGFRRHYPYGNAAAHVVGHLRVASQKTLDENPGLISGALVGVTGVEALRDTQLTGINGERWVVVSAIGGQRGVLREEPVHPGMDVGITLDIDLQLKAAEALGEHSGSIVAIDPRNGGVRIMYSAPSFDPNLFVERLSPEKWDSLVSDSQHPLQNRCIQGVYPPGSTIKPFYALAGLAEGASTEDWGVYCRGSVKLYGHNFRCWNRGGHGSVALIKSLEASCDIYYYLLGQRLGIAGMAGSLDRFGFGQRTQVGLAHEVSGLIGTPEWSRRVRKTPWYPGDGVSVSIGQGPLLVTTLQLARAYAALANGGSMITPYLVESDVPGENVDLDLDPRALALVNDGLVRVVLGSEGTARTLSPRSIAGKTGTAQVARLQEGVDNADVERRLRHHAWFVGWAPVENPRIVVVVLVEHGGGGGSVAAPIAGKIFDAALGEQ